MCSAFTAALTNVAGCSHPAVEAPTAARRLSEAAATTTPPPSVALEVTLSFMTGADVTQAGNDLSALDWASNADFADLVTGEPTVTSVIDGKTVTAAPSTGGEGAGSTETGGEGAGSTETGGEGTGSTEPEVEATTTPKPAKPSGSASRLIVVAAFIGFALA